MLKNRSLLTLWGGEFSSRIGISVFQIALLWYLLEVTGSPGHTGLVTMVVFLPGVAVGLWAGVFVDRLPYRRVMLGANAARCLLAAGDLVRDKLNDRPGAARLYQRVIKEFPEATKGSVR